MSRSVGAVYDGAFPLEHVLFISPDPDHHDASGYLLSLTGARSAPVVAHRYTHSGGLRVRFHGRHPFLLASGHMAAYDSVRKTATRLMPSLRCSRQ
jgi:hypothetical protein